MLYFIKQTVNIMRECIISDKDSSYSPQREFKVMERWFLKWSLNFHSVTCPWLLLLLKESFLLVLSSIFFFLILTKCCSSHKAFLNSFVMVSCTCPFCPGVHIPMVRMLGLVGGGRDEEGIHGLIFSSSLGLHGRSSQPCSSLGLPCLGLFLTYT